MALTEEMMLARSKLMTASAEVLRDILEYFGGEPKSTDRVKLVLEADKLFMVEMEGETASTSLLAFNQCLAVKNPTVEKEEAPVSDKIVSVTTSANNVKIHKDFKISGQIDSKAGISYTSLIRQIEAGLKKGHSADDVIDGVIRAVIPSSSLRSYLDGRQDMTLATLRGILRAHYAEKNSTELYTELASSVQQTKETSSEFLMRSMDLRNRILFASLENSDELKYSPDLVHKLFARTVQTGFRDQILRQEMKPILFDNTKTDAELLGELNKIVHRENENKQKVGKALVASVKNDDYGVTRELLDEIKALKSDVAQLKDETQRQKMTSLEPERRSFGQTSGCRRCREQKKRCFHCWSCGCDGHLKRNCPKQSEQSAIRGSSSSENDQGPR